MVLDSRDAGRDESAYDINEFLLPLSSLQWRSYHIRKDDDKWICGADGSYYRSSTKSQGT